MRRALRLVSTAVLLGPALAAPAAAQYVRVSVSTSGTEANGPSGTPSVSPDGRYVVFASDATNLVPDDTNGVSDVFLHDRDVDGDGIFDEPGAILTRRISMAPGGGQANGPSTAPVFHHELIAFLSRATNLAPDLSTPVQRVFGVTPFDAAPFLISRSRDGVPADGDCDAIAMGGDPSGVHVAFRSVARSMILGDYGAGGAIYVATVLRDSGITRVSEPVLPDDRGVLPTVSAPAIRSDGAFVYYAVVTAGAPAQGRLLQAARSGSLIRDLGPGIAIATEPSGVTFIASAWTDAGTVTTERRNIEPSLALPGPLVGRPGALLSGQGRYAAFIGPASTLIHDFLAGEAATAPIGGDAGAWTPNARWLAVATNQALVAGDTNGVADIVVADLPRVFDADQDGLDDRWERLSGLDPTSAAGADGAAGDPDGDGQSNAVEYATSDEGQSHSLMTHPTVRTRRYFAEGVINAFFDTELALVNPDPVHAAAVQIRYRDGALARLVQPLRIPPLGRRTARPGAFLAIYGAAFAVEIESDWPVVVDRRMTWDATGYGASLETARSAPAATWYLTEGTTAADFSLFYLLSNPQPSPVTATVRYLRPDGGPITRSYTLPPTSRTTIVVDTVDPALADSDVSGEITADAPIVAERSMYATRHGRPFDLGTSSAGVTAPAAEWFLAEGATGDFFDLYVLVANPSATPATVDLHFLKPDGSEVLQPLTVPPGARRSVYVDAIAGLEGTPVATRAISTNGVPIVVERAMYWPGGFYDYEEGHSSAGSTVTATRWAIAEGEDGGSRSAQTYVLIANVGPSAGEARLTLLGESSPDSTQVVALPANSRVTVRVGADRTDRFGVLVESLGASPAPLVVEGSVYWSPGGRTWAAGGNLLATPLTP